MPNVLCLLAKPSVARLGHLQQRDVGPVEVELPRVAGAGALHVVNLGAVAVGAVVVGQQRVVILVHAEVDHVPPVPHVQALMPLKYI